MVDKDLRMKLIQERNNAKLQASLKNAAEKRAAKIDKMMQTSDSLTKLGAGSPYKPTGTK